MHLFRPRALVRTMAQEGARRDLRRVCPIFPTLNLVRQPRLRIGGEGVVGEVIAYTTL